MIPTDLVLRLVVFAMLLAGSKAHEEELVQQRLSC